MKKPEGPGTTHPLRSAGQRHLIAARAPGRDGNAGPGPKTSWLCRAVLASTALTAGALVALTSAPASAAVSTPSSASAVAKPVSTTFAQARKPFDNPANPNCNTPGASPFNGGTGPFTTNQFESSYVAEFPTAPSMYRTPASPTSSCTCRPRRARRGTSTSPLLAHPPANKSMH